MFETGIRQARMAIATVSGRRIGPQLLERLAGDLLTTLHEFGAPGDDVGQLLDGPFADPDAREHFQTQAIRRTARRLAAQSRFYRPVLADVNVRRLTLTQLMTIPPTTKADLVARWPDLICSDVTACLSTRTTGTTGRPAEIWMSAYEARLWPALAALSSMLRGEVGPGDCLQVNISSRATAAVQTVARMCQLAGARIRVLGQVPVRQSLDSLLSREPTQLNCYPSYLAELVTEAWRQGLSCADFALRTINVGGEILSAALAAAATETFGAPVVDGFGMTEILPVSGRVCDVGHLHPDLNTGLVEVLRLNGSAPAAPGELGRMVVTPYFPYRDCMPVLRYDTGDVVRCLPEGPLNCDLAGTPAVSPVHGKASHIVDTHCGPVTTRDIVEILESLPGLPWPARYRAKGRDGFLQLTIAASALNGLTAAQIQDRFADHGIDTLVEVSTSDEILRHVRADLSEATFAGAAVTTGA